MADLRRLVSFLAKRTEPAKLFGERFLDPGQFAGYRQKSFAKPMQNMLCTAEESYRILVVSGPVYGTFFVGQLKGVLQAASV